MLDDSPILSETANASGYAIFSPVAADAQGYGPASDEVLKLHDNCLLVK